jgi:hypothetical protein
VRELQARAIAARNAAHRADAGDDAELTAVIAELAAMNARGDAVAPAVLCRLRGGERWTDSTEEVPEPADALGPVIALWQADGLIDPAEAPARVSTMILGVINSPLFAAGSHSEAQALASRVGTLVRRAFPPG